MSYWNGRTVLVTGAASGIGRALSIELASRGARLLVTDVDGDAAAQFASVLGGPAESATLDVRDLASFQAVAKRLGRVDALFNNAGMGVSGDTHQLSIEHWRRVIDVNLYGVINGVLAVYPSMVRERGGDIVNVASLAGLAPAPFLAPYAASKHAVVGLSTSLRAEAAQHGVRVNVICPASIETPLLDAENPRDLPAIPWRPNLRRYLKRLSGPPYPAEKFASEALDAVERNDGVIVIPGRARSAWRVGRFFPKMVERMIERVARAERSRD